MASSSFNPNASYVYLKLASTEEKTEFLDALLTNTTTIHLGIGNTRFNRDNVEKLATALKVNTTLTSLSLVEANPGEAGTVAVIDAIAINSTLISLNASFSSCVSTRVAQRIATMLEVNSTLQILGLGECEIDDKNAIALTRTLGINSTLTYLNLSHNQISPEGALEIGRVLSSNRTLTEMNFAYNESMGNKGMSAIIDAVILNPSLTTLNINCVGLTLDFIPKIVELIQATSGLRKLDIRSVSYRDDDWSVVDTTLAGIRDAIFLNETITSLCVISPSITSITDDSRALDNVGLRNENNWEQKTISLFELLREHLIDSAPEENFPIPQKTEPKKNYSNPHRDSFRDLFK